MAKKKKSFRQRAVGFVRRKFTRRGRSLNAKGLAIGALAYGAVRAPVSNALAPFTAAIPLGSIADEVALGGLAFFVGMKQRGLVGDISRAAFTVEMARIGEAFATGQVSLGALGGTTNARSF